MTNLIKDGVYAYTKEQLLTEIDMNKCMIEDAKLNDRGFLPHFEKELKHFEMLLERLERLNELYEGGK